MQFLKSHWVTLVCGVAIVAAVIVALMGMGSDVVEKAMSKEMSNIGANSIQTLQASPKNEELIKAAEQRNEQFAAEYARTLEVANEINKREPLMEGVFPSSDRSSTPLRFIEAYRAELEELPRRMNAGTLPTAADIAEEQQNVADLLLLEQEQEQESIVDGSRQPAAPALGGRSAMGSPVGGMGPRSAMGGMSGRSPMGGVNPRTAMGVNPRSPMGASPRSAMGGMQDSGFGFAPPIGAPQPATPLNVPRDEPKYDAVYRARVNKALELRCYVEPFQPGTRLSPTFHVSPIIESIAAPTQEEMWYAQVSLWIQQDVADAIAQLNRQAAQQVRDGEIGIQQMPVKRLKSVQVAGYQTSEGLLSFPSLTGGQMGPPPASYTGRTPNEQYDVVRFTVIAVVDQRDVLQLVDAISKANYYVNTGMSLTAVNRDQDQNMQGYFYGTEPVAEATLHFEGYLLRSAYVELMPDTVAAQLGIERASGG